MRNEINASKRTPCRFHLPTRCSVSSADAQPPLDLIEDIERIGDEIIDTLDAAEPRHWWRGLRLPRRHAAPADQEAGHVPDYIVGSSFGSIIGAAVGRGRPVPMEEYVAWAKRCPIVPFSDLSGCAAVTGWATCSRSTSTSSRTPCSA